jgi:hypothetical protein
VSVRLSRSAGLPAPLPDVLGLALRVSLPDGRHGDVLLSTTGRRGVGRFLLRPAIDPWRSFYSSLLPYRTSTGPLLIGAQAATNGSGMFSLVWSRLSGAWRPFATLDVPPVPAGGPALALSFDPVANEVPGLGNYTWVRRLRQPSCAAARRAREPS